MVPGKYAAREDELSRINQAMVLAAGSGKRLRPLTLDTPKALLCVGGKPMIAHILERLHQHGVSRVVVNTHYLAPQLEDYLKTFQDIDIIISHEPELLETGGGVFKVLSYFQGHPFFVMNADTWWQETDPSLLKRLESFWNSQIMDALLAIAPKTQGLHFEGAGDYSREKNGRLRFRSPQAPYVFIGPRILHPNLFTRGKPGFSPQTLFFHQAETNQRLYGIIHSRKWCDMGTPLAYQGLKEYLK